jgi:Family of unknown function (DUF6325)
MGPVQVLVLGFDHPTFSGEVAAELSRLTDAGIVRLVDLLLVERAADGSLETIDGPDGLGELAAALLGGEDGDIESAEGAGPTPDASWSLADAVPPGSVAAVALIEHTWAGPLRAAIHASGAVALEETWLGPGDLEHLEDLLAARSG